MTNCIFCEIIQGKIPAKKIYEDDLVIAILDHRPVRKGHTMVIPKIHVDHFNDLEDDLALHICKVAKIIGQRIQKNLKPKRVGFAVAGFGVPHAHYHIIPMWGDHDVTSSQYAIVKDGVVEFTMDHIPIADSGDQNEIIKTINKEV